MSQPPLNPSHHPYLPPQQYGYGYEYGQQPMMPVAFVPQQPTNGLGTAGGVVGIIACVLSFIPIIGIIAWVLAPIGLILSAVAVNRTPKGMAIAGIATSAVALLMCFLWVAALAA